MYIEPLEEISVSINLNNLVSLKQKIVDLTKRADGTPSEYNLKKLLERIAIVASGQWTNDNPKSVSYDSVLPIVMDLWLNYENILKLNNEMRSDIKSIFSNSTGTTALYDLIKKQYLPLETE